MHFKLFGLLLMFSFFFAESVFSAPKNGAKNTALSAQKKKKGPSSGKNSVRTNKKPNTSGSAYDYYTRGVELSSRKRYADAEQELERALTANPTYASAYIELARALVMQGKRETALLRLGEGLQKIKRADDIARLREERTMLGELFYTNDSFQKYQSGLNFMKLERPASASEALAKALKQEPDNTLVLFAYAQAKIAEDNLKEAADILAKAFLLNDASADVRVSYAEVLLAQEPEKSSTLVRPGAYYFPKHKNTGTPLALGSIGSGSSAGLISFAGLADLEERAAVVYARSLSALEKTKDAIEFLRVKTERETDWLVAQFWLAKFYTADSKSGWLARRTWMSFLKRAEERMGNVEEPLPRELKALRMLQLEADAQLKQVNQALE